MQVFRKIIVSAIMMLAFVVCASAQVTVTNPSNTTPGLAATYTDLTSAITALNAQTAISGPVTIAVDPGNPQTAPSGGYSITALLTGASATNTVTIDGSGNTITAANPAGTAGNLNDGFFKFIGSDFMILQNFIMNENPLNTTTAAATNNMMEWGVALLYATSTNGAQNITVQNNTITLNRTYQNTFGIYSNSTHTAAAVTTSASATTTAGGNSGLKVYGNTISNVNNGIVVVGPTAAADANTGIDIGGTGGAQANTITNFGTTGTFSSYANVSGTVNGILVRNSNGTNVSFNTISSSVGGTTAGTLNGIQVPASSATPATTFTNTINSNSISLQSAVATGAIVGISYPSGSASTTSTLNINNNNFNTFGHTVAASGTITFITTASTNQFTTINGNTFTNMSVNTTGSVTFISQTFSLTVATGTKTVSGNSIVTGFTKTGAGGTVLLVTDNGSSVSGVVSNCQNNNFSNITLTGATTLTGLNYTDGGTAPTRTVSGNTLNNWTTGAATVNAMNFTYWNGTSSLSNNTVTNIVGQGAITGITIGATVNTATSATISSNTINNLVSSGTGGTVIGISSSNSSPAVNISGNTINTLSSTALAAVSGISVSGATNTSVFKNKIYDIANSNASGNVNGIVVSGGTTVSVFNNRVGDLRTPAANAANPLVGLNITGGTTVNAYFNTFYLNGASTGALFGSSAVSASTTPTVTLRNNVFVNTSTTAGTGLAVAYRRSTATLTTYAATSNNNDFFASTIYTDGVTPQATIAAYKALVASRDSNSFSENPPFVSTTGSSPNFLQISLVTPTQLESGGTTVAGITDDFDGDTRNVTTPDIGADEFAGTPLDLSAPSIIYTPLANTAFTTNRNLTVTITDPSGVAGGVLAPRIYFKKSTDGVYVSTQCTGSSPTYTCTIDYALVGGGSITTGEILQYFVVAQDTAGNVGANPSGGFTATNVNTVTTPPTTPNQYTIVPAVSGNYNVGTAETITSLTNAGGIFDVINNGGVTGNVTISLTSDLTGESGTIALNQFTPGFTVTIKPSGAARTITGTGTNVSVIKLNGADNVDINGSLTESVVGTNGVDRSLTIINPNAATGTVAVFVGSIGAGAGANNVTIRNCVIQAGTKGTNAITTFGVFVGDTTGAAAGNDNDNFLFRNNQVKKTAIGIQAIGATTGLNDNMQIIDNTFGDDVTVDSIGRYGVSIGQTTGSTVARNLIKNIENADSGISANNNVTGLVVGTGTVSTSILRNSITGIRYASTGGYGGKGIDIITGTQTSNLTVANNFISDIRGDGWNDLAGDSIVGLRINTNTGGVKLYYNSINMGSGSFAGNSSGTLSAAFFAGAGSTNLDVRNNIFASNLDNTTITTDKAYAIATTATSNALYTTINNNDYFVSGTPGVVGLLNAVDRTALANWQTVTGQDAASVSGDPLFTSATDLHISLMSVVVYDKGTPVSVVDDFDGQTRSVVGLYGGVPDIGSDEALATTAANASVSGRITTANGEGIRNAKVMLSGGNLVQPIIVQTGAFGKYQFDNLPSGETYLLTVVAKRYTFATPTRLIVLNESIGDADFASEPNE
jgi:hypothetical protein